MKGLGTDEEVLINVLCYRSLKQRLSIAQKYKLCFGIDLADDIRSETSGNFRKVLLALLVDTTEFYARELHEAMKGFGTDENTLIEIMCMLSSQEIRQVGAKYFEMYRKSLESALKDDTSGHFGRLMTSLSTCGRDESRHTNLIQAKKDANELKIAGIDKWGTDESTFNRILCTRNYYQLELIAEDYQKLTGHSLENDIKKEFSGDIENGLLTLLRSAIDVHESYAFRLYKSMHGLGTNDKSLIRIVVTRCGLDMATIKTVFERKYGKTLLSYIKGDTSGYYRDALCALIGESV